MKNFDNLKGSCGCRKVSYEIKDKPLITQYFEFLFNAIQGDLGKSYIQKVSVSELIDQVNSNGRFSALCSPGRL